MAPDALWAPQQQQQQQQQEEEEEEGAHASKQQQDSVGCSCQASVAGKGDAVWPHLSVCSARRFLGALLRAFLFVSNVDQ
jgi:hypothetical protein